jgi:glycine betaine/proline transport system substrate-binding protein
MQQRGPVAEEPVVHPEHGKHLMGNVLDDKMKPDAAAKAWLKKNPQVLDTWLAGVTTVDGKPGLEAVKANLAK